MEKITHIEKIEIKGLWDKYNIEWNLNRDVNILAGINGSGKTTVLNLLAKVINTKSVGDIMFCISKIKIYLNNNSIFSISDLDVLNEKKIPLSNLNVQVISTFEQPIKYINESNNFPEKVKTDLDSQIFELQRAYLSYQINLGKRVETM